MFERIKKPPALNSDPCHTKGGKFLLLITLIFAVFSCQSVPEVEKRMIRYLNAVRQTAGLDFSSRLRLPDRLVYPRPRDLQQPVSKLRLGMLDYLSLSSCSLQELIAQRNQAGGRLISGEEKLIYEHLFLTKSDSCLAILSKNPEDNRELIAVLQEARDRKHAARDTIFWNHTLAAKEFSMLFSSTGQPLDPAATGTAANAAINVFRATLVLRKQFGTADTAVDEGAWAGIFAALNNNRYGGDLLQTLQLLTVYLNAVAEVIENYIASRGKISKRDGEKFLAALNHHYRQDQIQSCISVAYRDGQQFLNGLQQLAEELPVTDAFRNYLELIKSDRTDCLWRRFTAANKRHQQTWQSLLDRSGVTLQ